MTGGIRVTRPLAVLTALILGSVATPAFSADSFSINSSESSGVSGLLLASPPATCTGISNGPGGNCEQRGAAAAAAWADGTFWRGAGWSDRLEEKKNLGLVPAGTPDTEIGASWIPEACALPFCGHLLKGDVDRIDTDGDGVPDRTLADQFAWGQTSFIGDLSRLQHFTTFMFLDSGGNTVLNPDNFFAPNIDNSRIFLESQGTSPPGITRMLVRTALGDARHADINDITDPVGGRNINNAIGICDPDRFTAQLELDNCLWKVAAKPLTDPLRDSFEGQDDAVRNSWIDQLSVKYTASQTLGMQEFVQNWKAQYGFKQVDENGLPILPANAPYQNDFTIQQSDHGSATYPYRFMIDHHARVPLCPRKQGGACPDPTTNPTDEPLWQQGANRGQGLLHNFGTDFDAPADLAGPDGLVGTADDHPSASGSGVGISIAMRFLSEQNVNGTNIVYVCMSAPAHVNPATYCHSPFQNLATPLPVLNFTFGGTPTISGFSHPPQ